RGPFDPPVVPPEQLQRSIDDALEGGDDGSDPAEEPPDRGGDDGDDDGTAPADDDRPMGVGAMRRPPVPPRRIERTAPRGRVVGDRPAGPTDAIAVVPTVRNLAARRRGAPDTALTDGDLRTAVRQERRRRTIVLCVDLSGSMGAPERAEAATGTVLGLLTSAYEERQSVALVSFRGDEATTVVSPTTSVEIARNRLDGLTTGGATPLAAGLVHALAVAERAAGDDADALLVVLTDGRATGDDGLDRALDVAGRVAASSVDALVLDCETGTVRLGLAGRLAEAMGARCVEVTSLEPATVVSAIAHHVAI
ncbi:MAG: VWA domain-containing protein, partial [Actinomycetota bacterium]